MSPYDILKSMGLAPEKSFLCLNCGQYPKIPGQLICQVCLDVGARFEKEVQQGIEIEYQDGTKDIIKQ